MSMTEDNIHKHELIGLCAQITASSDKGIIGTRGKIVDETKNTFSLETKGTERTYPKNGTILAVKIQNKEIEIDFSHLRFRPEDRIKKAKKQAILCIAPSLPFVMANGMSRFDNQQSGKW